LGGNTRKREVPNWEDEKKKGHTHAAAFFAATAPSRSSYRVFSHFRGNLTVYLEKDVVPFFGGGLTISSSER